MKIYTNSNLRLKVKKILWITLGWFLVMIFFIFLDRITLAAYGFSAEIDLRQSAIISLMAALLAGIAGGVMLVFVLEGWLRRMPPWRVFLQVSIWYSLTYVAITCIATSTFFSISTGQPMFSQETLERTWQFLGNPSFIKGYVSWGIINLLTIFVLQVSDKYGPMIFGDFLLGKYFRPTREERIFMFLDIRSSTSIAEKLGEVKYFNLVNDFIRDCTESILASRGQIYQYVGDEIVVTWNVEKGVRKANCLRCFFNIQKAIADRAAYYQESYGLVPEFKAGLHYGFVMAGEIGLVKKEIAFSGDVLNTAARIQSMCNKLGVDILLSKYLLDRIPSTEALVQQARLLGDIELRGKRKKVMLYTV